MTAEADMMTGTEAATCSASTYDDNIELTGVCWECAGPCLTYKGSVHGWTCRGCLARHLDEGAAKADAKDRRDRERLLRKAFRNDSLTPTVSVNR